MENWEFKAMSQILVILGSSRNQGYTRKAITQLMANVSYELVDLQQLNISSFDYDHANKNDDHVSVIAKMAAAKAVIFATPVYWYAMSSQMKIFFDRFSDLLTIQKEWKHKLAGKRIFLLSTGSDADLPEGFEIPFRKTCDYLGMTYCRSIYFGKGSSVNQESHKSFVADLGSV